MATVPRLIEISIDAVPIGTPLQFALRKFYTRQEAWRLAQETQQILHRVSGDEAHGGTLFSENLY